MWMLPNESREVDATTFCSPCCGYDSQDSHVQRLKKGKPCKGHLSSDQNPGYVYIVSLK